MKLDEFIKEALVSIADGVIKAENICHEKGASVNPIMGKNSGIALNTYGNSVSMVKFHVGLCESSCDTNKSGIGVFLSNIDLGHSSCDKKGTDSITSIEFTIPIKLPYSKTDEGVVYTRG